MKWGIGGVLVVRIALSLNSHFYANKAKAIADSYIKTTMLEHSANMQTMSSVLALVFWGLVIIYLWRKKHIR